MFELITEELIEECYMYCYKRIYNKNDAEDISQTILLEVITAMNRKREIENFYAWFWGVARNQILLYFKSKEKKPILINYDNLDDYLFKEDREEYSDELSKVRSAITRISEMYRNIIISFYLKNLSIKEIATNLSITTSAVKKRLFDARKNIKKEINKMEKTVVYDIPYVSLAGGYAWPDYSHYAETKIRKSILAVCYDRPLSINEISEYLNINPLYLDDDINILVTHKFLIKKDNKYETNIILYRKPEYNKYLNGIYELYSKLAYVINDLLDEQKEEIEKLFITNYDYDELKWSILPRTCTLYTEIFYNKIAKKYPNYTRIDRPYYANGVVSTSTDEDVELIGSYLGWSNLHCNFLTSEQEYLGTIDMFQIKPFSPYRSQVINESNIDIIERIAKGENPIQSKKDELLYAELVKHKVIINNNLAITYCKKEDWYKKLYEILRIDLNKIVEENFDEVEGIANKYLLPMVKKNLYGDFYEVGIKIVSSPVTVVSRIAYDNKWIRNIEDTTDSWYGFTILLDNE